MNIILKVNISVNYLTFPIILKWATANLLITPKILQPYPLARKKFRNIVQP